MKKEYLKPEQRVVVLKYKAKLLVGASNTNTNLGKSDDLTIDDNPTTDSFWGR